MTKKLKPKTKRRKYTKKSKPSFVAPLIILIVIIVLIITVITVTLSLLFHNPEKTIKDQLSALSKDYYENHLYESLTAAQESTTLFLLTKLWKNTKNTASAQSICAKCSHTIARQIHPALS